MKKIKGIIWKTEEEMKKKIEDHEKIWKKGLTRDGFVVAGRGEFKHKGIKYKINILRYYTLNEGFKSMSSCGEYNANLEHDKSELSELVESVSSELTDCWSDFLFADTMHIYNEGMSIEQKVEDMHERARDDIDNIGKYETLIETKIAKLSELGRKLKELKEKGG